MTDLNPLQPMETTKAPRESISPLTWIAAGVSGLALFTVVSLALQVPLGVSVASFLSSLLGAGAGNMAWYITRSAGLTAYLLLWLSVLWGLAIPSKILDGLLHGSFTFDFHEFISLLGIGFLAIHLGALLFDAYMPYSVLQILIPGLSSYRPLWIGVGIVSCYLTLLVTVTFYLRSRIGQKAFRAIHVFSLVAFLGAALHGLLSGSDTALPAVQAMYAVTLLSVVFLTAYWLISLRWRKKGAFPARMVKAQP